MNLTSAEQEMLSGAHGKGIQLAMELLVKFGQLYGAERFLPVSRAHIDAAAYTTIWTAGTEFLEWLVENGARVAVPTTINPLSRDIKNWKALGASEDFSEKSRRLEEAYLRLGVIATWTCAPYQCSNVPRFGEIVSWSESNAVNFVNSVVGARAERLPDLVDVCCAVAGRVPAYGRYLKENRRGDVLFCLEGFSAPWFTDSADYALLGYFIGEAVVNKVPVIEGLPAETTEDQLKALSAAAASAGAVSLFHVMGLTPEAPTREAAFQGWCGYEAVSVTPADLTAVRRKLDTAMGDHVDMVLLGCPHFSAEEMRMVARCIGQKTVFPETDFWIMTSETQYHLAERCGIAQKLEHAGVVITRDTCVMEMDEGDGRWTGKNIVTNSGKVAQYAPGINGVRIKMATLENCVQAAVTGKLPKECRV